MIYLDNSATTRPCDAAISAAREMLEELWFNPSAPYAKALEAEKRVREARANLCALCGADDAIFTGCGTEADALAILGSAARWRGNRRVLMFSAEHPAALETATELRRMGHAVDFVPATREGVFDLAKYDDMLGADVAMVCCMQVNNETGAIQPLAEISRRLKAANPEALLFSDGIQGFLRVPMDMRASGVDLYAVSAHKIHGIKGVGALMVRAGARLSPRLPGGGQEKGLRSGTENTAGIVSFAAAATFTASRAGNLMAMKLRLVRRLREAIPNLIVNGSNPEDVAPHILNISLPPVGGEVLLHALETEGVLVGTGAACSSKKRALSPAFAAMGLGRERARTAIRISLGCLNEMDEMDAAAAAIIRCYDQYQGFARR